MTRRRVTDGGRAGPAPVDGVAGGDDVDRGAVSGGVVLVVGAPGGVGGAGKILADQNSGALYVRVGDKLYPALNLSSARLIVGEPANPERVRRSEIDAHPRGPLVGIAGAPQDMSPTSPGRSSWLVCDEITKAFGWERTRAGDGDCH